MPPESGVPWCQTIAGPSGTPASTTWRVRPSEVVTSILSRTLASGHGACRARTGDLRLAKAALFQLS